MAIQQLTPEQIRTMSLQEKDKWWLTNVFKGNEPQLTVRSAMTGMILGGVLSLTNIYVGIKTGWTLGVGVTSVVLSYALYKGLAKLNIGSEMHVLENNAMQSIATSAGYMTAPLIASLPAYMMVTNTVIPMWQAYWWMVGLSLLGVLFAFPMKKKFINDLQLPFPEGYAAGVVLDSLHSEEGNKGIFKAKLLLSGAGLAALIEFLRNHTLMEKLRIGFLALPEYWDDLVYKFATPAILGSPLKDLTVRLDTSIVMLGAGGLMGIRVAMSLLLGAIVNYMILAPIMISNGIIEKAAYKSINLWSLWGGAAMMTTASLYVFFAKPEIIFGGFRTLFSRGKDGADAKNSSAVDILKDIELPMKIFLIGIPIISAWVVWMGHAWFGVEWWLGLIAIPFVFVMTIIAVNSTGLTAITPGSALAKLTQITYAVLAPGNKATNLMTAGITTEVALNASNLLMDIKPGYMLGAKPRQQAIGHVLGVFAGGLVAVPVFYSMFNGDISLFSSDKMPMPGATVWKGVADVLAQGFSFLHSSAQIMIVIGALVGIAFEFLHTRMKNGFPISAASFGLGFILRFHDSLAFALGALLFWYLKKVSTDKESLTYRSFGENGETIAAGIVAGGSIVGLVMMIMEL
jgi:OPT family oligopeptide transporter